MKWFELTFEDCSGMRKVVRIRIQGSNIDEAGKQFRRLLPWVFEMEMNQAKVAEVTK